MKTNEFKATMKRHDDTQEKLAEALNLGLSGLNQRINGKIDFRAGEIKIIIERYSLTPVEIMDIFFDRLAS